MENDTTNNTPAIIKEVEHWVNNFWDIGKLPKYSYSSEAEEIISMSYLDITNLTSEECYAKSLILINYASFIQKELDLTKSKIDRIESELNRIYAKEWANQDPYSPAEIKKATIIHNNSYCKKLDEHHQKIMSSYNMIKEVSKDLRRQSNILQELGKKKSYEHN